MYYATCNHHNGWSQAEGLEFTSATRGSFLMSVTALLTPALAIVAGEATTRSTIIASILAVFGVGLIVLDDTAGVPGISPTYQMIGAACLSFPCAIPVSEMSRERDAQAATSWAAIGSDHQTWRSA